MLVVDGDRHVDRTRELVALFARVLASGVGELGFERILETGEAFEVFARQPHCDLVGDDRAAHTE